MQNNLIKRILKNRILIAAVVVAVAVGGYYAYKGANGGNTGVAYETTAVEKGTIVQSVSGSGQVSAETQIDIKPEVSARILDVAVAAGQAVNEGDLLFRLDGTDAQKTVRDAENALESARLSLAKLQAPADALSMLQAQNALKLANESAKSTQDDLDKAYSDGFNAASSVFLDLPTIVNGLDDILYGSNSIVRQSSASYTAYYIDATKNYDAKARQYGEDFSDNYAAAKAAYDKNIQDYKAATIYSDPKTIQSLVEETYATVKAVSEAVKSANNLVQLYKDEMTAQNTAIQSFADTHLTGLGTYTIKVNSETSGLLSAINTIESKKQAVVSASRSIQEKEESLAELKAGADANDLRAQELAVEQRENALMDAKEKLADYTITAPINGTVASVNASVGDSASAGTALAVMITKQQVAEIALNEVDVAEVKAGQKGTVTFDAIDGLTLTGKVTEIDAIGTVSQGVVSYNTTVALDAQDDRVKPGMSTTVSIIADARTDVLMVPNAAIKADDIGSYVEIMPASGGSAPARQAVETGLSNDEYTEIKSGLKEGDTIISGTVTTSAASTSNASSNRRAGGFMFGGGPDNH